MEVERRVVRNLQREVSRGEETARAYVETGKRLVGFHGLPLELQHRMVGGKALAGLHDAREHLGGDRFGNGLAVLEGECRWVGGQRDIPPAAQRARLRDEALVPAGREIHVRVELQEPVLAPIERHRDRACPAGAARIFGFDAHVARALRHRRGGGGLLDDAEMQLVRPAGIGARALDGEAQERVAVRRDADEDRHPLIL
jgi:hypothetical protein